ncbi:MAG: hypothetical protein HDR88_18195 [Bacteroides sp.]|nr:hypothetical protein [Bacteroides sp.]
MENIFISPKVAQLIIAIIIIYTGEGTIKWFMHEMGLDKNKKTSVHNRKHLPFLFKVKLFLSETLLQIAKKLTTIASKIAP